MWLLGCANPDPNPNPNPNPRTLRTWVLGWGACRSNHALGLQPSASQAATLYISQSATLPYVSQGVWVAKRSLTKATYAGLLDQMVAGGQPAGLSFVDNVRKECEEEASLPPAVLERVRPAGLVSYRYTTKKGLSTKVSSKW